MKILFVASEVAPFCKTGGLADVAGSLPQALAQTGADVRVIVPLYEQVEDKWRHSMEFLCSTTVRLAWRSQYCGIFELRHSGVTYYFVDNKYYFNRHELYGHYDDGERYAFFCKAVLDILPIIGFVPEIIHANDWQSALIPIYLKLLYNCDNRYQHIKSVFTIHNIQYQGQFSRNFLEDVAGIDDMYFTNGMMAYDNDISLMKGAIICADFVTTVSRTYAEEIQTAYYGHGLDAVLRNVSYKLRGVVNGIDTLTIDPRSDEHLFKNYGPETMNDKLTNKLELMKLMGLKENPDTPIIAIITRLAEHKGIDLIGAIYDELLAEDVNVIVLGKGDWKYEQLFHQMKMRYPKKTSVNIMFSADLANKIYAGSDMILMPSKSEPCGLAQMMAMRYGTIPIVRETGGLKDTVPPYNEYTGEGMGFSFRNYNAHEMLAVIRYALNIYRNHDTWHEIMHRAMTADFSWSVSAAEYIEIYKMMCEEK